jgi:hypothetical protein
METLLKSQNTETTEYKFRCRKLLPHFEHQEWFFGVSFIVIANEALSNNDEKISKKYKSVC